MTTLLKVMQTIIQGIFTKYKSQWQGVISEIIYKTMGIAVDYCMLVHINTSTD